jgi:Lar family restriction alleviation protein
MGAHSYSDLMEHVGHKIECVTYANGANVAVECLTCSTVLMDFDRPDIAPCPFCGEQDSQINKAGDEYYHVQCYACGALGPHRVSKHLARVAWNSRENPA